MEKDFTNFKRFLVIMTMRPAAVGAVDSRAVWLNSNNLLP